jgi:hypothetical protein
MLKTDSAFVRLSNTANRCTAFRLEHVVVDQLRNEMLLKENMIRALSGLNCKWRIILQILEELEALYFNEMFHSFAKDKTKKIILESQDDDAEWFHFQCMIIVYSFI